ncbi:MAG: ABC transporter ATP-binding protein [Hyphomicrobiaceae bacterium]
MTRSSDHPLLVLEGISKSFPGVKANDNVSFTLGHGEIHALLGENGAGKSTLVKMIYGVLQPDAGSMHFNGEPYRPRKPSDARAHGIGMVFQHFSLFEALTVNENVALGISPELARDNLAARIVEVSDYYGLKLEPERLVGTLSVGERQRVEIVRCLLQNPRLVIMDEPTSVLTPQEVETLFRTLRRLAEEGCSILYISHKLEEIRSLCDTATVLRGGRVVATTTPAQETARSLAEMMIGTALAAPKRAETAIGPVRLALDGLRIRSDQAFGIDIEDMTLEVRAGEIVGIAGVAGNGQVELIEALIGELRADRADAILIDGKPAGWLGPAARRRLGLASVPEERLGHAAVPDLSLADNVVLSAEVRQELAPGGFINSGKVQTFAQSVIDRFNVKANGVGAAARSLSGGNLQKFVVGREVMQEPTVLVASQPTWGVDAGAAAFIHEVLMDLASKGAAVLVISQDLDELFEISTRIAVIAGGRLSAARPVGELTIEAIGLAMGGKGGAEGSGAHA